MEKFHAFDVMGNIALVRFPEGTKSVDKKKFANKILKENKSICTILEKTGNFSGRLRKQKTEYLAGEKSKEVLYRENNCSFRFNIDSTYFSSRLSNERKEIAEKIEKGESVFVMFAGVGPFSIVIAKNSKAKNVFSNELNREANKYAEANVLMNKVGDRVLLVPGDIKKVAEIIKEKFDVIIMPRPQLKDSFLEQAFNLSKKGTRVYYYDFCKVEDTNTIVEKVKAEASKFEKRIKILNVKKAGEIAPYKVRLRVDFKIL